MQRYDIDYNIYQILMSMRKFEHYSWYHYDNNEMICNICAGLIYSYLHHYSGEQIKRINEHILIHIPKKLMNFL